MTEPTVLILNAPSGLFSFKIPEQYTVRKKNLNEQTWRADLPANTVLAVIFCTDSDDINLANDLGVTRPDLAIIIVSDGDRYKAIATQYRFGSMANGGSTDDFLRAETAAFERVKALSKKTG